MLDGIARGAGTKLIASPIGVPGTSSLYIPRGILSAPIAGSDAENNRGDERRFRRDRRD